MSRIISQFIDENEILESFRQTSDTTCNMIAEQHAADVISNADVSLFEKMYLPHCFTKKFEDRFPENAKTVCIYQKNLAQTWFSILSETGRHIRIGHL